MLCGELVLITSSPLPLALQEPLLPGLAAARPLPQQELPQHLQGRPRRPHRQGNAAYHLPSILFFLCGCPSLLSIGCGVLLALVASFLSFPFGALPRGPTFSVPHDGTAELVVRALLSSRIEQTEALDIGIGCPKSERLHRVVEPRRGNTRISRFAAFLSLRPV